MNELLEDRLRSHLADVDRHRVSSTDAVTAGAATWQRRIRRRRRGAVAAASLAIVTTGAMAWMSRSEPSGAITERQPTASTAGTASTPTGPDAAGATLAPTSTALVEPLTEAWTTIAPSPAGAVQQPAVVWTGTEAIVVGGLDADGRIRTEAAAYSPVTGRWRRLADAPIDLVDPVAIWTGTEAVFVGGTQATGGDAISVAFAYDPAADTWRQVASPYSFVTADAPWAWTGESLLVWPIHARQPVQRYDPAADEWSEIATPPIVGRDRAASVWTGSEWIIWGGRTGDADDANERHEVADGAAYDPEADTWRVIAPSPLSARRVRAVWTGSEMLVTAGSTGGDRDTGNGEMALSDGAGYDPVTDTWRRIGQGPAHPGFVPVWTGDQMVVFAKGFATVYDPPTDQWIDGDRPEDTDAAVAGTPVWTGDEVLVLGSFDESSGGALFRPDAIEVP